MKCVCNTSPLIFLAKLNLLSLLEKDIVTIPDSVHKELSSKECSEQDAIYAFLKGKNIRITRQKKNSISSKTLGIGEIGVINIAKQQKIKTVIMDDKRARSLARSVGLETCGTLWIILHAVKKKKISKKKAYEAICDLPRYAFRINSEFLLQILKKLR